MTWLRRNGFYYRSERVGDTVRSVYVGNGFAAEAQLAYDAQCRAAAAEEAAAPADVRISPGDTADAVLASLR